MNNNKFVFKWWYILLFPLIVFLPLFLILTSKKTTKAVKIGAVVVYLFLGIFAVVSQPKLKSLTIVGTKLDLVKDEKTTLDIVADPIKFDVKDIECKSSNTDILGVYPSYSNDNQQSITANNEGTVTVTCTIDKIISNTLTYRVTLTESQIIEKELKAITDAVGDKGYQYFLNAGFTINYVKNLNKILVLKDFGVIDSAGSKRFENDLDVIGVFTVSNGGFIISSKGDVIVSIVDPKGNTIYKDGVYNMNYLFHTDIDDNLSALQDNAKTFIKKLLKAPSTAEFPGSFFSPYKDWNYYWENNIVNLSSYVDAENSFGAMIRTEFLLQYTYKDGFFTINYAEFGDTSDGKYIHID